jgi:phenylalanyl-tRNA synthetase alpha subunit
MPTLDEQYLQTVNEQKNYLQQLQTAFNQHCDQITAETQSQLAAIPETDPESRQKLIEDQKKKLAEALGQMKTEIELSSNATRRKLEEIHTAREVTKLTELEETMKNFLKK